MNTKEVYLEKNEGGEKYKLNVIGKPEETGLHEKPVLKWEDKIQYA
jgi:hypothetical protein